jgi:hypothetical protein
MFYAHTHKKKKKSARVGEQFIQLARQPLVVETKGPSAGGSLGAFGKTVSSIRIPYEEEQTV